MDFSDSEGDDSPEQAREAESRSYLGRMVAGLGRLLTGSGKKDAEKKRRRRRPNSEDEAIEVVPIFHLGADDTGTPEEIARRGLDDSENMRDGVVVDLAESQEEDGRRLDLADSRRKDGVVVDLAKSRREDGRRLDLADSQRKTGSYRNYETSWTLKILMTGADWT